MTKTIHKVEVASFSASDRCRFVVYRIDPLMDEYHIYKEVRDSFGGTMWFGAIQSIATSEASAIAIAQRLADKYAPPIQLVPTASPYIRAWRVIRGTGPLWYIRERIDNENVHVFETGYLPRLPNSYTGTLKRAKAYLRKCSSGTLEEIDPGKALHPYDE